jgi:uncharacterized protein (TIGR03435 family)
VRKIAIIVIAALGSAAAQTPDASLQFEVASIKASPPPDPRGFRMSFRGGPGTDDPGLLTCENWGLSDLITLAYEIQNYQLSGPEWMGTTRFMVSAKIPPGTTREQFHVMLQNLLAERFKLTLHREKKELPAYTLVVAKNGPKFKESVPSPAPEDPDLLAAKTGPPKRGEDGYPILPAGRESTMAMMNGYASQRFSDATLEYLATHLGFQLHAPVIDATGLKAKYDFTLHWVSDRMPDDAGPNLLRAVQEQLGLRLESKKTLIDVLVVDHLEKAPTEN